MGKQEIRSGIFASGYSWGICTWKEIREMSVSIGCASRPVSGIGKMFGMNMCIRTFNLLQQIVQDYLEMWHGNVAEEGPV